MSRPTRILSSLSLFVVLGGVPGLGWSAPLALGAIDTSSCTISARDITQQVSDQLGAAPEAIFGPRGLARAEVSVRTSSSARSVRLGIEELTHERRSATKLLTWSSCEELRLSIILFVTSRAAQELNRRPFAVTSAAPPRPPPPVDPPTWQWSLGPLGGAVVGPLPNPAPAAGLVVHVRSPDAVSLELWVEASPWSRAEPRFDTDVRARLFGGGLVGCPFFLRFGVGRIEACAGATAGVVDVDAVPPADNVPVRILKPQLGAVLQGRFALSGARLFEGAPFLRDLELDVSVSGSAEILPLSVLIDRDTERVDVAYPTLPITVRGGVRLRYLFWPFGGLRGH